MVDKIDLIGSRGGGRGRLFCLSQSLDRTQKWQKRSILCFVFDIFDRSSNCGDKPTVCDLLAG